MKSTYFAGKQDRDKKDKRWNKDCEAAKFLKAGLENGDIDPNKPPKVVWESFPIFQKYVLTKFRAALNKIKADMGCHLRKKGVSNLICFDKENKHDTNEYSPMIARQNLPEPDTNMDEFEWKPIHTLFRWMDSQIRDRLTVLVLMPSGVNADYTVSITSTGTKLEIKVKWPDMLCDPDKLHEPYKKSWT